MINAGGVSGVEIFDLASTGANTLTLANANFVGVPGGSTAMITVNGGNAGNTVDASAVTGTRRLTFNGGIGVDVVTGGAGDDVFNFSTANLANADLVTGGARTDRLAMTDAGTINAGGVSGVEIFNLTSSGDNTLTVADDNFTGVTGGITVNGGNAGNVLDASAVTATTRLTFNGGTGDDIVLAAAHNHGSAGENQFTFDDIGTNIITDFGANAANALVLRDAGFDLGANEGQGTAGLQHLDDSAFTANSSGAFTTTNQRFAYNMTTGNLAYDRDGSGSTFSASSVAVLSGHPSLGAGSTGQVLFTS